MGFDLETDDDILVCPDCGEELKEDELGDIYCPNCINDFEDEEMDKELLKGARFEIY